MVFVYLIFLKRKIMNFGQAIKSYFVRWNDFKGRSSRSEYWWATLFSTLVNINTKAKPNKTHTSAFLKTEFIAVSPHINIFLLTYSLQQQVYKFELNGSYFPFQF